MNSMDNRTRLFLVLPFVLAAVMAVAADHIPFGTTLNNTASDIMSFVPRELKIREQAFLPVTRGLQGPFDFTAATEDGRTNPDGSAAAGGGSRRGLSLIVIGKERKMALIEDTLVKEGDRIDDKKVARIESDRILLMDKTMQWKYMEGEQ